MSGKVDGIKGVFISMDQYRSVRDLIESKNKFVGNARKVFSDEKVVKKKNDEELFYSSRRLCAFRRHCGEKKSRGES